MAAFGIVGNFVLILLFSHKRGQRDFYMLMIFLALFDLSYVSFSVIIFGLPHLIPNFAESNFLNQNIPSFLAIVHISLTGSIYFTIAVTIERYLTVCHPYFKVDMKFSQHFSSNCRERFPQCQFAYRVNCNH